uniref:CMP-N-acetylneuraminate-beta-galactosamide-alpha-2,3-sialyltransferase 1 n=1 Tax=Oryctolagus cuniculus TaxID=9986 RepID=G1SCQ4_RABIT
MAGRWPLAVSAGARGPQQELTPGPSCASWLSTRHGKVAEHAVPAVKPHFQKTLLKSGVGLWASELCDSAREGPTAPACNANRIPKPQPQAWLPTADSSPGSGARRSPGIRAGRAAVPRTPAPQPRRGLPFPRPEAHLESRDSRRLRRVAGLRTGPFSPPCPQTHVFPVRARRLVPRADPTRPRAIFPGPARGRRPSRSCPRRAPLGAATGSPPRHRRLPSPASARHAAVHVARPSRPRLAGSPAPGGKPSRGREGGGAGRRRGGPRAAEAAAGLVHPGCQPGRPGEAAPRRSPRLPLPLHLGEGVPETAPPSPRLPAPASAGGAHYARQFRHFAKTKRPGAAAAAGEGAAGGDVSRGGGAGSGRHAPGTLLGPQHAPAEKTPAGLQPRGSHLRKLSAWFDERFNQTMQPLLTAHNALMEEDTYRWWLKLQREKKPNNLNDTIKELFSVVPGDVDPVLEKRSVGCRRCAVVGNSGNLRESSYGPDIDSHDFVLRMNKAPTVGFEGDVGSKTTHHLVYPESFRELGENVSMVLVPFKTIDLQWVVSATTTGTISHTYVPVPAKIKVKQDKILIYHPAFIKYVFDNWLQGHGRYPSTGILSVIFSMHICDEVDLYGFGADSKGNWHHYWENNPSAGAFRKTGVHDADFESNVTATLAAINKIRIFKGR